jgi:hypothetical protein
MIRTKVNPNPPESIIRYLNVNGIRTLLIDTGYGITFGLKQKSAEDESNYLNLHPGEIKKIEETMKKDPSYKLLKISTPIERGLIENLMNDPLNSSDSIRTLIAKLEN